MKKFTATLLAAALTLPGLAAPAMAQPQPQQQSHSQQTAKTTQKKAATNTKTATKTSYKTFRKGDKFDRNRARNYQVIDYRKYKKLPAPRKGYRYVRAGSDVLLIGTSTFKVYAVYTGMIR